MGPPQLLKCYNHPQSDTLTPFNRRQPWVDQKVKPGHLATAAGSDQYSQTQVNEQLDQRPPEKKFIAPDTLLPLQEVTVEISTYASEIKRGDHKPIAQRMVPAAALVRTKHAPKHMGHACRAPAAGSHPKPQRGEQSVCLTSGAADSALLKCVWHAVWHSSTL